MYIELLRRGYQVSVGRQDAGEVDFVVQNGADRLYVQVANLLATDEIIEHEFSVLERISDNYPKYVLSMDAINRVLSYADLHGWPASWVLLSCCMKRRPPLPYAMTIRERMKW